jgi:hypothetical protein
MAPVIMIAGRFPPPEETVGGAFALERPFEPLALLDAIDRVLHPEATDASPGA